MIDIVKDWWGLILALTAYALGGAWWLGRMQKDVDNLKAGKYVANETCAERQQVLKESQQALKESNTAQFAAGNAQFTEIKALIAANDQASQHRHQEVMNHLLNLGRNDR